MVSEKEEVEWWVVGYTYLFAKWGNLQPSWLRNERECKTGLCGEETESAAGRCQV